MMAMVFALSFSVIATGASQFSLKKVPGSSGDTVTAINNSSQVVVNKGTSTSYDVLVWSRKNGFQDLGLTGMNSGGAAIDNLGDVVGAGDPDNSGVLQAFLWQPTGGVEWLGSLGGGLSGASGVNASGAVVGLSYTAVPLQHAFLWTQAGGMQDLTPALTSIGGATATAVNAANEVVGYYFPNGSGNPVGFTWTEAGGLQNLGPAGTVALAVNDARMVVGQSPNAGGYSHAFSWTENGGMMDLGTLGGTESTALGVNNLGWVVGTSLTNSKLDLLHAFLWTPAGGMQDLATIAGVPSGQQAYWVKVNDYGVIALSTNAGLQILIPKMTVTVTSSANPAVAGEPITFTATVTSLAGAPPDGETMEFMLAGKTMGSATLSNGVAQFTTSTIPAGTYLVAATYQGDDNYLASTSASLKQVVNP